MTAGGSNPLAFIAGAIGFTGNKFSGLNVKRVYFGNWLYLHPLSVSGLSFPSPAGCPFSSHFLRVVNDRRDYSQAVDVGTLGRGIKLGTIRVLVWVMGFMANGYATEEFEVPYPPPPLLLVVQSVVCVSLDVYVYVSERWIR